MSGAQLDAVVRLVRETLGDGAAMGAYLHGSSVLGGLRPLSDLDVLVVVRRALTEEERRALVNGLMRLSLPTAHPDRGETRSVELTVVVQSDVRPWRYPPRCELQYGDWLRGEYERGVIAPPQASPDLAILMTNALAGDAPLFGPAPAALLDPVPAEDVRRAIVAGVPHLMEDLAWDTRNVLLTLARMWVTLETGEIVPKDAAAAWVLARLPEEHRPPLAHARAIYLGAPEGEWDDVLLSQARPLAEYLVAEIGRLERR